jgi:starch phosphorylase
MNILHLIMIYHEMLDKPEGHNRLKRTAIIGGKAAPGYETAKDIIQFIYCIARKINRDPIIKGALKIVFVENYNVTKAEVIIPAADLSEQISTAGMEASGTGNMKFAINGALTIGTRDGANIEMEQEIGSQYWPFAFGYSSEEIKKMRSENSYSPRDVINNNPKIKRAIASMVDRTFAQTDAEQEVFTNLYRKLVEYGNPPDRFFVLADLESYYQAQLKVEALYSEPQEWARYALYNITRMGKFSSDRAVQEYSKKVWGLTPCPIDFEIYEAVKMEFSEYEKFHIY